MSIKVPREVWGLFLSAVAAAGYVYYNGMLSPKPPPIIATGKWRDNPALTAALEKELNQSVRILRQAEEGLLSAQSAHAIVRDAQLLPFDKTKYVLYVEAGGGSTQMTVLDCEGKMIKQALSQTGLDKKITECRLGDKQSQLETLNQFKDQIELVVMYGSFYHHLKTFNETSNDVAVDDEDPLTKENERMAKSSLETIQKKIQKTPALDKAKSALTFVPEWVNDACRMLVIRNVRIGDELRKPSWGTQQPGPFVDLGSGKAALTDPKSGTVIKNDAGVDQSVKYDIKDPVASIATKVLAVQSQTYAGDK